MKAPRRLGSLVDHHYRDRANLHRILELGQLVQATTALIHELQRERGLSSGFVASDGRTFQRDLTGQRARTDAALKHARDAWAVRSVALPPGNLGTALAAGQNALGDLDQWRRDVDTLGVTATTAAQRFTSLIDHLLVVVAEAPGTSPHPQVTLALIALFHFVLAKEFTGQERALGSAICAQGHLEPFQGERFQVLGRHRAEALQVFTRHASADQLTAWEALATGVPSTRLQELRDALAALPEGDAPGPVLRAQVWFDAITEVIEQMRSFEKNLLEDLDELCLLVLAEARSAWEDNREVPEEREALVLRRLERAQVRLLTERQIQRQGHRVPPAQDLTAGSSRAIETVHRWGRDLERLDTVVQALEALVTQAKVMKLNTSIEAMSRAELGQGAQALTAGLESALRELRQAQGILALSGRNTSTALEALHAAALNLQKESLS